MKIPIIQGNEKIPFWITILEIPLIITFQVISHIDEDFNNSRKQKNTILKSSYKPVN